MQYRNQIGAICHRSREIKSAKVPSKKSNTKWTYEKAADNFPCGLQTNRGMFFFEDEKTTSKQRSLTTLELV